MAKRNHLYPSRTQKLSSLAPKILGGRLPGKIGRCRFDKKGIANAIPFFILSEKIYLRKAVSRQGGETAHFTRHEREREGKCVPQGKMRQRRERAKRGNGGGSRKSTASTGHKYGFGKRIFGFCCLGK